MQYAPPSMRPPSTGPTRSVDWLQIAVIMVAALIGTSIAIAVFYLAQRRSTDRIVASLTPSTSARVKAKATRRTAPPPPPPPPPPATDSSDEDDDDEDDDEDQETT